MAGLLNLDLRTTEYRLHSITALCPHPDTHSQQQVEHAYRQAVFNVIFNNKDDHSKNCSFIMNNQGQWTLSPAYDLTYNSGINGEHHMDICGGAKHPTRTHLLDLAKAANVDIRKAKSIIAQVSEVARTLPEAIANQPVHHELAGLVIERVLRNIQRVSYDS